jgi:hypothetical protein
VNSRLPEDSSESPSCRTAHILPSHRSWRYSFRYRILLGCVDVSKNSHPGSSDALEHLPIPAQTISTTAGSVHTGSVGVAGSGGKIAAAKEWGRVVRSLVGGQGPYSCPVLVRMRVVAMRLGRSKKSDSSCHHEAYS